MAKKKTDNKIPLPILMLICACLLFAMYISLSTLMLAIWGDSVTGTVDSYDSRLDDMKAEANRSRTVSKGYYFTVEGKEYRGYVMYQSEEAWPSLDEGKTRPERISYLALFPYVNKPSALADFGEMGDWAIVYHILSPIGYLLLLLLVIRTAGGRKKKKTAARKSAAPQIIEVRSDADMFCSNCGSKLPEGAAFCSECGAKAAQKVADTCAGCEIAMTPGAAFCAHCGAAVNHGEAQAPQTASFAPQDGGEITRTNLIGFSDYHNHPEILAAAKKSRRNVTVFMWILVFAALIGFPIAGLLMDDFPFGEAVIVGVFVSLMMLLFGLVSLRRTKQSMWEGVVTNKFNKQKQEKRDDPSITYTEYTVAITTDTGKKKTIVEKDPRRYMYDYLSVGDRVRYHPKFSAYEKYDKSKDRIIYCIVCTTMNPIQNDRCKRCNNLLFK